MPNPFSVLLLGNLAIKPINYLKMSYYSAHISVCVGKLQLPHLHTFLFVQLKLFHKNDLVLLLHYF